MRMTAKQEARYKAYLDELVELADEQRKKVEEAKSYGDLSENAEYDAARSELSKTRANIADVEEALSDVTIISTNNNTNKIGIGTVLKLRFEKSENGIGTGIKSLDDGEWFELVESSKIILPHMGDDDATELPIKSLLGSILFGKKYNPSSPTFTYRDTVNVMHRVTILEVAK